MSDAAPIREQESKAMSETCQVAGEGGAPTLGDALVSANSAPRW